MMSAEFPHVFDPETERCKLCGNTRQDVEEGAVKADCYKARQEHRRDAQR